MFPPRILPIFIKDKFTRGIFALQKVRGEERELLLRKAGKYGYPLEYGERGGFVLCRHSEDFTRPALYSVS